LLVRELFSPSRGLFTYNAAVRTVWFQQQEETETADAAALPAAAAAAAAAADGTAADTDPAGGSGAGAAEAGTAASATQAAAAAAPQQTPHECTNSCKAMISRLKIFDLSDVFPDELNSFHKLLEIEDEAEFNRLRVRLPHQH
ncbi:hypothetical protein EAH_00068290, partial [Eimeria acervulina]